MSDAITIINKLATVTPTARPTIGSAENIRFVVFIIYSGYCFNISHYTDLARLRGVWRQVVFMHRSNSVGYFVILFDLSIMRKWLISHEMPLWF